MTEDLNRMSLKIRHKGFKAKKQGTLRIEMKNSNELSKDPTDRIWSGKNN